MWALAWGVQTCNVARLRGVIRQHLERDRRQIFERIPAPACRPAWSLPLKA